MCLLSRLIGFETATGVGGDYEVRLQIDCLAMCEDATSHHVRAEYLVTKGASGIPLPSPHQQDRCPSVILGNSALARLWSCHAGLDTSLVHCKFQAEEGSL